MKKGERWTQRIALGTVQFGLPYGISNKTGQVSPSDVANILEEASRAGIDTLDTAAAYGTSEDVIGEVLESRTLTFQIVSKFPADVTPQTFDGILRNSLEKIKVDHLQGYLAHSFASFQQESIRDCLRRVKERGLVRKIGVSVYSPQEVNWLFAERIEFDLIQLPFNVFDQRFRPILDGLKARGIEVHARSVFLQGLLLMPPDELPAKFASIQGKLARIRQLSEEAGIPLTALLMNYVLGEAGIDKVVIGVTGPDDLRQDLEAGSHMIKSHRLRERLHGLAVMDEQILLPYNWR